MNILRACPFPESQVESSSKKLFPEGGTTEGVSLLKGIDHEEVAFVVGGLFQNFVHLSVDQ